MQKTNFVLEPYPKFKVGDRVRLIMDPDIVYIIIAVYGEDIFFYDIVAENDSTLKLVKVPEQNLSFA